MATRKLSPSSRTAESPERRQRLEEKKHISELNSRLENYILKVREREAELAERTFETDYLKISVHESSLSAMRVEYDAKMNAANEKYNNAIVEIEELSRKLRRESARNDELTKTIDQLEQAREDLQKRIARLSHDLDVEKAKHDRDAGLLESMTEQLDAYKKNESDINDELEQLRANNRKLAADAAKEHDLRVSAENDLKFAQQSWEQERAALYRRAEELSGEADDIEREIRAKLRAEFQEELARLLARAREDHNEILAKQLADFRDQLDEMRRQESELIAERDELRSQVEKLHSSSHITNKERAENERKLRELEKRIEDLLNEIEQNQRLHNKEIQNKNNEISRLRGQLRTIEDQRNILLGLGVGLKKAVETYERIISEEEHVRHIKKQKIESPKKASPAQVRSSPRVTDKLKDISASPKKPASATKVAVGSKRKTISE